MKHLGRHNLLCGPEARVQATVVLAVIDLETGTQDEQLERLESPESAIRQALSGPAPSDSPAAPDASTRRTRPGAQSLVTTTGSGRALGY